LLDGWWSPGLKGIPDPVRMCALCQMAGNIQRNFAANTQRTQEAG